MAKPVDDASLKRLGGGRWQTRDDRFTIEPQSGTWVVVDAEQTDDLGLPLVRGPFASLAAAKAAITTARGSEPADSPLPARAERLRREPAEAAVRADGKPAKPSKRSSTADDRRGAGSVPARPKRVPSSRDVAEPPEPRWLTALEPDVRRRARRLLERLTSAGADDPEGIARRDIVGEVPAAAAWAVRRAVAALGPEATPAEVLRLLADGRDDALDVRWHLVDGEGRRLTVDS